MLQKSKPASKQSIVGFAQKHLHSAIFKGTKHFQWFMLRAERIVFTNGEELTECDIILTEEGVAVVKDDQFTLIYHHSIQSLQFSDKVAINFMRARALSHYLTDVNEVQDTLEDFDYAIKELQEHLNLQVQQVEADATEDPDAADNGKNPYA
ncbi:MAG: hypothetical protein CME55_08600 [Halieaceae bacterium]|nr:hypothetical protein [Halieaceae bacterium]